MSGQSLTLDTETLADYLKKVSPITNTKTVNFGGGFGKTDADEKEFDFADRVKTISYLRNQSKTNSIFDAILSHYGQDIGTPKFKIKTGDGVEDDLIERVIEEINKTVYLGKSLQTFDQVLKYEVALCGETFVAFLDDEGGKVRIIPAEFIGSDPKQKRKGEIDGIITKNGYVTGYRVGRRNEKGEISFTKEDSKVYPAEFIRHINPYAKRAESLRAFPPLATAVKDIENLSRLIEYKVACVKTQSKIALLITKDMPAEVYAQAISVSNDAKGVMGSIFGNRSGLNLELSPDGITNHYLNPGEDAKAFQSNIQNADFEDFCFSIMNRICATLGMNVFNIIGYTKSNYISVGANNENYNRAITQIRNHLKETLWDSMVPFLLGKNGVDEISSNELNAIYPMLNSINSDKTAQTDKANIEGGTDTKTNVALKNGRYMDEIIAEEIQEKVIRAKAIKKAIFENPELTPDDFK
jgi:capsid protein